MRRPFLIALAVASLAPALSAQAGPPDSLVNTQVIPRDTSVREVIAQMRQMAGALGVRCTDCHVGTEAQNVWTLDFASDEKEMKRKARVMMRMVKAINEEHLSQLADLDAQGLEVTCLTCHRRARLPVPLEDLLLREYAAGGLPAMRARYDTLRAEFHGRAVYDFGDITLKIVADRLLANGQRDDALVVYADNADRFPAATFTQYAAGEALLAAGDSTTARHYFVRAVEADSTNRWARAMIRRIDAARGGG